MDYEKKVVEYASTGAVIENWLKEDKNIKLIIAFAILTLGVFGMFTYTIFSPTYSFKDLITPRTLIDLIFMSSIIFAVQYVFNIWITAIFRNRLQYKESMDNIFKIKRKSEKTGHTKALQDEIDIENEKRKINAYLKYLDIKQELIEKKQLKKLTDMQDKNIQIELAEIEKIKRDILNKDYDVATINIEYNRVTKGKLFAGSNIGNNGDIDYTDDSQQLFWKGTLKTRITLVSLFILSGGIGYSTLEDRRILLFMIFAISIIITIILTWAMTLYLETFNTLPKLYSREDFLMEFSNKYDIKLEEEVE